MPIADQSDLLSQDSSQAISLTQEHLNDFGSALPISAQLEQVMDSNEEDQADRELNLNLGQVGRITSAGLNELIGINSLARSRGFRVVLLDVQEAVREVFTLTRLERMFEFRCSAIEA